MHNVELNNLYSLPYIIISMKSMRMKWAEHVARMGQKMASCKQESMKEENQLEDLNREIG